MSTFPTLPSPSQNDAVEYEVLDKDYGRAWAVGPGYGQLNQEQYRLFIELMDSPSEN